VAGLPPAALEPQVAELHASLEAIVEQPVACSASGELHRRLSMLCSRALPSSLSSSWIIW
jgi:hypothetical protein